VNTKQLKDSILHYAMQGKLVENILDLSFRDLWNENIKKSVQVTEKEEVPFEIPTTWVWARISDLGVVQTGNTPSTSNADYYNEKYIPFIKPGDLIDGNLEYNNEYLSKRGAEKARLIEENSILMVCIGGSRGKSAINDKKVACNQQINTLTVNNKLLNIQYIYFIMQSRYFQNLMIEKATGTATPIVNKTTWSNLIIPIAPLNEQIKIVEKIRGLFQKAEIYQDTFQKLEALKDDFPNKLENSVLQYAFQGKLVEQDSNDDPAQQLFETIQIEKEQLIKRKVIKKGRHLPTIREEEIPYDVPNSWEWVRLGELCYINPKNSTDDELDVGFIPMRLIQDGAVNKHSYEKKKWKEIKKGFTHFQNEDIVVAKITPCFENRKSAIIKNLPNGLGAGTTEIITLRTYSKLVDKEYLLWILKSNDFIDGGKKSFTGTAGQQRVARSYIENYLIPLPPQKEQRRIVQAIYKIMNLKERL